MEWLFWIVVVTVNVNSVNMDEVPKNISSYPCTDHNHVFLVPGVLTAGGTNRACVSRFHHAGPVRMTLTLYSEQAAVSAVREMAGGDGGCIDISVPLLPNTKAELVINLRYPSAQCTWEKRVWARILGARVVVVLTERARVRPGDVLRARILLLKADLTPAHGSIDEIWLEGPRGAWEGARAAEWRRVRTRLGVGQIQHRMDDQAPPGRWTVRVKLADGSQGAAAFQVGEYELPPFQLSVRHAPKVLSTSDRLVWTVCVRYPWTEAVEGMLVIRIRGEGPASSSGIRTAVRLRAPRACHRHAAAAKRVGIDGANSPDVVVADFSFQEESTRIWQNTTVVSQVVHKHVSLEFLTKHRVVISPWLPYKLKVKATRWDDKTGANERVQVCRTPATSDVNEDNTSTSRDEASVTCNEGVTDADGVARVLFSAEGGGSLFYRFHATLKNDSSVSSAPLYLPLQHHGSVHAALGPLKSDGQDVKTFVPLYLSLKNVTNALTVHFVVITRGGIIYRWGATTQCPSNSGGQIQTASRNSPCFNNEVYYNRLLDNRGNSFEEGLYKKYGDSLEEDPLRLKRDPKTYGQEKHYQDNSRFNRGALRENQGLTRLKEPNFNEYLNKIKARDTNKFEKQNNKIKSKEDNGLNIDGIESNEKTNKFDSEFNPDSLIDKQMLRIMLPVKVSHQMCPDSHLIAYFFYNGEFVSASKRFEMEECFVNKVEASFPSRQAAPGSSTTLHLSTAGPALCALTALDSASKWVQPGPTVKDVMLSGLRRLVEGHRNLTEYDAAGDCFLTSDTLAPPSSSLELTASWLAQAGIRMVGGDKNSTLCTSAPSPLIADDVTVPRSDFSEAWLWRLIPIGVNGTATVETKAPDSITRYEASAVCVARNGVAVSQPAVLQVFREFFIHADSPRRLRRGDTSIVRYRIFNYLYEPLSVQIQILTDPHLEGPKDYVETACISARSSIARRVDIKAKLPGSARVSVRAKSVRDGLCGNYTTGKSGVSDEVIIEMTVDPEGVPVQDDKSILLCGRGSKESDKSEVSWNWPSVQVVPGTESLRVWAVGDLAGPLFADADDLVKLPRGCGEQNLARMATNLLAIKHLDPKSTAYATARQHLSRGFTRQFQYLHPSGGFSAFGSSDATPSTWLTAFALRYLRQAHQILSPSLPPPSTLDRAERWLLSQQMENGCFRNEGQVFHKELRGGLNEEGEIASVALTAYVITSLINSAVLPSRVIRNALSCLRALPSLKPKSPSRIYAHSLLAYAFMRLKRYEEEVQRANEASLWDKEVGGLEVDEEVREVVELLKMAKKSGDFVWWETGSLATSIEATSYALLALSMSPPDLREESFAYEARGAIRWLSTQRSASGGFVATQDTLIALEALTSWSSTQSHVVTKLNVTARSGGVTKVVALTPGVKVPDVMMMGMRDELTVRVEGTGCALIQATRSYNTYAVKPDGLKNKKLSVQVTVYTDGAFDCDANKTSCFCAAIVETCVLWTGLFPEMALLEVTLPGGFGADASLLYSQLHQDISLLRRIELSPSHITYYLGSGSDSNGGGGHQCWKAHTVGPKAKTQPAHVRVKSYYEPEVNDTQMYTIPEECPSRISREHNQYLPSDNLFMKARSATYDLDISKDFSFDDLPDGLPLEDPLYDNLTRGENMVKGKIEILAKDKDMADGKIDNRMKVGNVVKEFLDEGQKSDQAENDKGERVKGESGQNSRVESEYIKDKVKDKIESTDREEFSTQAVPISKHTLDDLTNVSLDSITSNNPKTYETTSNPDITSKNSNIDDKLELKSDQSNMYKKIVKIMASFEIDNSSDSSPTVETLDATNQNEGFEDETENKFKEKAILAESNQFIEDSKFNITDLGTFTDMQESGTVRKSKFFTDEASLLDGFDPKPIEVEINSEMVRENEIVKTAFDIDSGNLTESETNQETPPPENSATKPLKQDINIKEELTVENPNLSSFHIIDSVTDLEVPDGIEGPIPSVVLPPSDIARSYAKSNADEEISQLAQNYRPSDEQLSQSPQNYRPSDEQLSKLPQNYRPSDKQLSQLPRNYRPSDKQLSQLSQNYGPFNEQLSQLPQNYRPSDEKLPQLPQIYRPSNVQLLQIPQNYRPESPAEFKPPPNYRRPSIQYNQNQWFHLPNDQEYLNLEQKNYHQPLKAPIVYPDRHTSELYQNERLGPEQHSQNQQMPSGPVYVDYQLPPTDNEFQQNQQINQQSGQNYQNEKLNPNQVPNNPSFEPGQSNPLPPASETYVASQQRSYFYQPMAPDTYSRDIRSRKLSRKDGKDRKDEMRTK